MIAYLEDVSELPQYQAIASKFGSIEQSVVIKSPLEWAGPV